MNNIKKMKEITENLKNFLNIDVDHIQSQDIEKIINLPLPMQQIDNLIKITERTNENLELLKDNLIKNRNLIAEEISCLNDVFVNCHTSVDSLEKAVNQSDLDHEPVKDECNSDSETENNPQDINCMRQESPRKQSEVDYEAKKILLSIKKMRNESIGPPPMLDLTKFN